MTPLETIKERKIVAIVRGLKPEYLLRLGHALEEGGIGLMEVTYNQREPETWTDTARGIEALEKEFGERLMVGAGTVITPEQVRMTYNAGGHYLVTPATQPEIIRMGKALGLGLFPGALTPTEILEAYNAGADAVKVFPASVLGTGLYQGRARAAFAHPADGGRRREREERGGLHEGGLRRPRCRREPCKQRVDTVRAVGHNHSPGKRIYESGE